MTIKDFHQFCTGLSPETVSSLKGKKKQKGFSTHVPLWKKKNNTRSHTKQLVNKGIIKKENCAVCDSPDSEIHHRDYNSATDIIWLCKLHHTEAHKELRRQQKIAK